MNGRRGDGHGSPSDFRSASPVQVLPLHLEQAFASLRRSGWPARLQELEKDPLRSALVRLYAGLIARGRLPSMRPVSRRPAALISRSPAAKQHVAGLDRKRLASGERDEPD